MVGLFTAILGKIRSEIVLKLGGMEVIGENDWMRESSSVIVGRNAVCWGLKKGEEIETPYFGKLIQDV